ncbi:MAG: TonB-dependent receptor [Dysgonamonadaceae bacterium]|jgi:TonB-linked SusC/RagA family outer membrane protein|nr:TonB-dependent receptor [Dysgonamonadaceae bacterium]
MRQKFFVFLFCLLSTGWGYAQSRIVSGVIIDKETNEPLIGATIVGGSDYATVADYQGRFSFVLPASVKQITISYLGYEAQTVSVTDKMTIALVPTASALEEVVILANYAMVKKKDLAGAISILRSDENFAVGKGDVQQALQGRIAGVNVTRSDGAPGGGVNVQIRGTSTLFGSTEPLYVLDGVPLSVSNMSNLNSGNDVATSNTLSFLDPNDIESIEVLKDASSIALYGSRGVNGVVLITTKSGQNSNRDRININYNVSVSEAANRLQMLSSREYAHYVNQTKINTALLNGATTVLPGSVSPYNGQWNEQEQRYNELPDDFPDNDNSYWQDQIFRTAITHDLSIDLSGSGKSFDWSFLGSLSNQEGVVKNSSFDRYSGKLTLNKELKTWLKIGSIINISYTISNMLKNATNNYNNGDEGVIRSALFFPPTFRVDDPRVLDDRVQAMATNPLTYTTPLNQTKGYSTYTSNYANITLMKGLVFRTVLGYSTSVNEQNQYFSTKLWEGRTPKNGLALAGDNTWSSLLFENMLMYNHDIGKHNISATLSSSWEQSESYYKYLSVQGFASDYSQGWYLGDASTFNYVQSGQSEAQLLSGIFRAAYNYSLKYYLTLTGRYDVSSKFAKGNKGGFFPSVGLAYSMTQEPFMESIADKLNNLKLRLSYGHTGNQAIGSYATFSLMTGANYPFGSDVVNGYAMDPYNPGNINLTWETTKQIDMGLDVGLFNKVDLTVDLYHRKTTNVLQPRELSPSTGVIEMMDNIGEIMNQGIEVTLNAHLINNRENSLKWDVGATFSANKNEITRLGFGDFFPRVAYGGIGDAFINAEGHPIGQLYGYVYDGIWKSREEVINSEQFQAKYPGYSVSDNTAATEILIKQKWVGEIRYKNLDDDPNITEKDQTFLGTTNPDFIYGFTSSVNFKNFDLYVLLQGVYGNKIFNQPALRFYDIGGSRNLPVDALKRAWSPENPDGTLPKLYEDYGREFKMSSLYYENGSYCKIRSISLGYTFRNIKGLNNMRLYASGNNLFTFTKYSGFDPEVNSFNSSPSIRGIDGGGYPQARSFIFGLNFNF